MIDQEILRVLLLYEQLSLSELWFEIGEARVLGPMTKEQISSRLESLKGRGFVDRISLGEGNIRWALNGSSRGVNSKAYRCFKRQEVPKVIM